MARVLDTPEPLAHTPLSNQHQQIHHLILLGIGATLS